MGSLSSFLSNFLSNTLAANSLTQTAIAWLGKFLSLVLVLSLSVIIGFSQVAKADSVIDPIPTSETVKLRQLTSIETQQLDDLAKLAYEATNEGDFARAEDYWTLIIKAFPFNAAAWSNRGNARVSQNLLELAIADYDRSIQLAPQALDPYLNRGTAYEGLAKFSEAIADYDRILAIEPQDAMAWNNHGNAQAGLGKWQLAIADYQKAADLAPNFAFARANYALALYQIGEIETAITQMRNILRKYPDFPDVRAAYAVALWTQQKTGEAESNWVSVEKSDRRYSDLKWVKNIRRWPPSLVMGLENFLQIGAQNTATFN